MPMPTIICPQLQLPRFTAWFRLLACFQSPALQVGDRMAALVAWHGDTVVQEELQRVFPDVAFKPERALRTENSSVVGVERWGG